MASVRHGFCPPWPCDFEWCMQVSFKWHNRDIIDNRDCMETIIVMLENPQSLSPSSQAVILGNRLGYCYKLNVNHNNRVKCRGPSELVHFWGIKEKNPFFSSEGQPHSW